MAALEAPSPTSRGQPESKISIINVMSHERLLQELGQSSGMDGSMQDLTKMGKKPTKAVKHGRL